MYAIAVKLQAKIFKSVLLNDNTSDLEIHPLKPAQKAILNTITSTWNTCVAFFVSLIYSEM